MKTPAVEVGQGEGESRTRARVFRAALLALIVGAFVVALGRRWEEVAHDLSRLDAGVLVASAMLALVGAVASLLAWRTILADLGSLLPVGSAARLFFVSALGKYVPGSVWPVVVQMRLGRDLGVPGSRLAFGYGISLALSVTSGLAVGLLMLPWLIAEKATGYLWLLALLPFAAVCLRPRVLNVALDFLLRRLNRGRLERPLSGQAIAVAGAWLLAFWGACGLHLWLLMVGLGAEPLPALPVAIGGFALAFCVGVLLVVLPAGAGAREAALLVLIAPLATTSRAVVAALVSRLLLVAVDGLAAGLALMTVRGPPSIVRNR